MVSVLQLFRYRFVIERAHAATALSEAAVNGHDKVVGFLLGYYMDFKINSPRGKVTMFETLKRETGEAYMAAVLNEHAAVVEAFHDKGYRHANAALKEAAAAGNMEAMDLVLEWCDERGVSSSLNAAVENNHGNVVRRLSGMCTNQQIASAVATAASSGQLMENTDEVWSRKQRKYRFWQQRF